MHTHTHILLSRCFDQKLGASNDFLYVLYVTYQTCKYAYPNTFFFLILQDPKLSSSSDAKGLMSKSNDLCIYMIFIGNNKFPEGGLLR